MKNILLILSILLFFSCKNSAEQDPHSYMLKGTLKGIDSGLVKLVRLIESDGTSKTVDSAHFSNYQFELKGSVGLPEMMSIVIEPGNWRFGIFMEDANITVVADTTGSEYYDYSAYKLGKGAMIKQFTVTGSRSNSDWFNYLNHPEQKKFDLVFKTLNEKFESTKDAHEQDHIRGQSDSVRKLLVGWQTGEINNYISKSPNSVAGIYMFDQFYIYNQPMPIDRLESTLNKFEGDAKASVYYNYLSGELKKKKVLLPGNIAPDFTLLQPDSSKFTLSSNRGKYLMIDFWASWCVPCRAAIPHWKKVYSKYHNKGFEIVSVSDDSRWNDWTKAMKQEKMPWIQVIDEFPLENMPAKVGSLYMTNFIPFYVLLDKEGRILVYSGFEEDINKKLSEIFDKKAP